ncbi:hypothetical protein [Nonomuraea sp. NPDC005692]|uniref:hypothetical protein n=1 Tax=Nonomuraea sp. NPDC005692 TaxID=3157168 RepID=UPI0033EC0B89
MAVSVRLVRAGNPGWHIHDVTGGWVAVRRSPVPRGSVLSNVRCGATLDELSENLAEETRIETTAARRLRAFSRTAE